MKRRILQVLLVLAVLALSSCAARSPATTWGWSSWYMRGGFGDQGSFKGQRSTCLAQMGISETDAAGIQPDSSQEIGFIQCMNGAGWCTQVWNCNKPGAG